MHPLLLGGGEWSSHSNIALRQCELVHWCAKAITNPCNVVVPNHLQTIWFSVTVSYYVEQPPHCDRLRLSLSDWQICPLLTDYLWCWSDCVES